MTNQDNKFSKTLENRETEQRLNAEKTLEELANDIGQQRASHLYDDLTHTGLKTFDAIVSSHMEEAMYEAINDIQESMVESYQKQDLERKRELAKFIIQAQKTHQINRQRKIKQVKLNTPSLQEVLDETIGEEATLQMNSTTPFERLSGVTEEDVPKVDF